MSEDKMYILSCICSGVLSIGLISFLIEVFK